MSEKERNSGMDLVERSKMIFLKEIVEEFREKQSHYDVGTEFAKTKRNRNFFVPGVILALVVVFSVVVIGVTWYIQSSSRAIRVNIDDFTDVNLRDVLDEAHRLQNQLDMAQRELAQVRDELQSRIRRVERERDRGIQLLSNQNLGAAQRRNRRIELEAQAQSEIESLQAESQPRIAELEELIASLHDQIAQYDTRQLEQAREQEEILNNQQKVNELEKRQIREHYEAEIDRLTAVYEAEIARLEEFQTEFERTMRTQHRREMAELHEMYDPVFADGRLRGLLEPGISTPGAESGVIARYDPFLGEENAAQRGEYRTIENRYAALRRLVDRLQEIPYENSVSRAIAQIEERAHDLVLRYEDLWMRLRDTVIGRDAIIADRDATISGQQNQLDEFLFALEELTRINGETGYILDPRDTDEIDVYVSRIRTVREGALGYVFRRDDEFVGLVRFFRRDGRLVAELVESVEDQALRAFDKILVEAE